MTRKLSIRFESWPSIIPFRISNPFEHSTVFGIVAAGKEHGKRGDEELAGGEGGHDADG